MKFAHVINFVLTIIAAYGLVLALPMLLDFAFDTRLELITIVWINVGIFVMCAKKMPIPLPDSRHVDVSGGLRLIWWALFWPSYLSSK